MTYIGREIREAERIVLDEPVPSAPEPAPPSEPATPEPEEAEEFVPEESRPGQRDRGSDSRCNFGLYWPRRAGRQVPGVPSRP